MEERGTRRGTSVRSVRPNTPLLAPTVRDFRSPLRPSRRDLRLVAGYELLEEIGQGGMGVVYKARQVQLNRLVALKMLRSSTTRPDDLIRFRTEAEAVAQLVHPGIVQIHEIGEHEGQPFISLEYVAGGSLDRLLASGPLQQRHAAELVQTLALTVHFAHQHGIIHRDLKPANVLLAFSRDAQRSVEADALRCASRLNNCVPKISDFGLAKRLDTPAGQTQVGEIIGTPSYMAPEQAEGRNHDIGPAVDIYALGAILYECLTGRPPFLAGSLHETIEQVRQHDPATPRSLCPGVSRDLETICLKCLDKSPRQRYASAAEVAADIGRFLAGEPIIARPVGGLERWLKWARRRPTAAALVVVSTLLVAVLVMAMPLHVLRLQARIREFEDSRLATLYTNCKSKLNAGRALLSSNQVHDLQEATVYFATIKASIQATDAQDDPELAKLGEQAEQLHQQASKKIDRLLGAILARTHAEKFLALRDEAFFLLHHDLLGRPDSPSPDACLDACQKALTNFPELDCLSPQERKDLLAARQEVFLLMAEATARKEGRLREALDLVDRAAQEDGGPVHAIHLRRARYLRLLGDEEAAEREQRLAEQTPPSTALEWFLVGQERRLSGDIPSALEAYDRALREQPGLFWPRLLQAILLQQLKEYTKARAGLDICIQARPNFACVYLLRAIVHTQAGQPNAAEMDLQAAARLPLDAQTRYTLHITRGVVALAQGQHRRAVEEFQHAVRLGPRYHHGYTNLAHAYGQSRQFDRALASLDHAIHLAPGQPGLYRTRCRLHVECGHLAQALADIERAINLEPASRPGHEQAADLAERARLLYSLGRYHKALPACQQALALKGDDPVALRLRAEVLLELGRHAESLIAFDRYLSHGKPDAQVYRRRARARAGTGDLAGVIDDYTLALALPGQRQKPGLFTARGWAHLVNSSPQAALRDFESALKLAPNDADALIGRAQARLEHREVRLALADVEKALASRPTGSRILYNAARVLALASTGMSSRRATQQRQLALAVLQQAVEAVAAADRARFWREQVCRDRAFRELTSLDGYQRLDRRWNKTE